MKYSLILIIILAISSCQSQTSDNSESGNVISNSMETQKIQKNKLKPIPVMAENNSVVGGAFLLPEDWEGNATMQYEMSPGLDPWSLIEMKNNDTELKGVCFGSFLDSPKLTTVLDDINRMGMDVGLAANENLYPAYLKSIQPIEQFTQEYIYPQLKPEYKPTQITEIHDYFLINSNQNQVLLTTLQNTNNPEKSAYLLTIYYLRQFENSVSWKPYAFNIEGSSSKTEYMMDILKLVGNSFQFNPIFLQYIDRINQQMNQNQINAFNQQQNSIKGMQDHFYSTLNHVQQTSKETYTATAEQYSDMMLDVTTYKVPGMNQEIKLPSSNEYYYSNNLGDFVGTDNPLFDPNSSLTSIYNWQLLQSKY